MCFIPVTSDQVLYQWEPLFSVLREILKLYSRSLRNSKWEYKWEYQKRVWSLMFLWQLQIPTGICLYIFFFIANFQSSSHSLLDTLLSFCYSHIFFLLKQQFLCFFIKKNLKVSLGMWDEHSKENNRKWLKNKYEK